MERLRATPRPALRPRRHAGQRHGTAAGRPYFRALEIALDNIATRRPGVRRLLRHTGPVAGGKPGTPPRHPDVSGWRGSYRSIKPASASSRAGGITIAPTAKNRAKL